jgi:N-methylhydantoinase B
MAVASARIDRDGQPVVRVHLTNDEHAGRDRRGGYLIRVDEQRLRRGSGGRHRGSDGMVRNYTVLADGLSLTTMFRSAASCRPYGMAGGAPGLPFRATPCTAPTARAGVARGKNLNLAEGDRVVMETSGGGGYGQD